MNRAAQALGRLAKGKSKTYTKEELDRRKKQMAENQRKRWANHAALMVDAHFAELLHVTEQVLDESQ